MPGNQLAMAIAGGIFILVGIICIIWGSRESAADYRILIDHADVHTDTKKLVGNSWKANSGAGALIAGGIISIIVGAALIGLMFYLINRG